MKFHDKNKDPDPLRLSLKGVSHGREGYPGLRTLILLLKIPFCKFLSNFYCFGQFSMMGTFLLYDHSLYTLLIYPCSKA